jgi:hypothetical protein
MKKFFLGLTLSTAFLFSGAAGGLFAQAAYQLRPKYAAAIIANNEFQEQLGAGSKIVSPLINGRCLIAHIEEARLLTQVKFQVSEDEWYVLKKPASFIEKSLFQSFGLIMLPNPDERVEFAAAAKTAHKREHFFYTKDGHFGLFKYLAKLNRGILNLQRLPYDWYFMVFNDEDQKDEYFETRSVNSGDLEETPYGLVSKANKDVIVALKNGSKYNHIPKAFGYELQKKCGAKFVSQSFKDIIIVRGKDGGYYMANPLDKQNPGVPVYSFNFNDNEIQALKNKLLSLI